MHHFDVFDSIVFLSMYLMYLYMIFSALLTGTYKSTNSVHLLKHVNFSELFKACWKTEFISLVKTFFNFRRPVPVFHKPPIYTAALTT